MSFYRAIWSMYSHARGVMQPDDLSGTGVDLQRVAVDISLRMSRLLDGLSCMVAVEDIAREKGFTPVSGSFVEATGVSDLLALIGEQFEMVAALVEVGGDSIDKAEERRQAGCAFGGEA